MERDVILTGIGGQGVQLAAQTLARGATFEGRAARYFAKYGGEMRGGSTEATVVIGDEATDGPLETPPIISHTWSAIAMHGRFWEDVRPKVADGGIVVVNSGIFDAAIDEDRYHVVPFPATEVAAEIEHPLGASMLILGAYIGLTDLVPLESVIHAMWESLPSYRERHATMNEKALRRGFDDVTLAAPAWATPEGGG